MRDRRRCEDLLLSDVTINTVGRGDFHGCQGGEGQGKVTAGLEDPGDADIVHAVFCLVF